MREGRGGEEGSGNGEKVGWGGGGGLRRWGKQRGKRDKRRRWERGSSIQWGRRWERGGGGGGGSNGERGARGGGTGRQGTVRQWERT